MHAYYYQYTFYSAMLGTSARSLVVGLALPDSSPSSSPTTISTPQTYPNPHASPISHPVTISTPTSHPHPHISTPQNFPNPNPPPIASPVPVSAPNILRPVTNAPVTPPTIVITPNTAHPELKTPPNANSPLSSTTAPLALKDRSKILKIVGIVLGILLAVALIVAVGAFLVYKMGTRSQLSLHVQENVPLI